VLAFSYMTVLEAQFNRQTVMDPPGIALKKQNGFAHAAEYDVKGSGDITPN